MLTSLDVTVMWNLFPILLSALTDVQFSLQTLSLRYCMFVSCFILIIPDWPFYFSSASRVFDTALTETHVPLHHFMALKHFTLYTCPRFWHCAMRLDSTWHCILKTWLSSCLHVVIQYEGNDSILNSFLCPFHIESMLNDGGALPGLAMPLHRDFHLELSYTSSELFCQYEYDMVSTVLDIVMGTSPGPYATVFPVEFTTYKPIFWFWYLCLFKIFTV